MQISGMGQCAHSNQPIQHMIYLYDYAGEPWKTQYWVRETTPVRDQYALGTPLFRKLTLTLENGKQVNINAALSNNANKYVSSLTYSGKVYTKNWISHAALQKGAVLNFTMSATPNKLR
jgi:putative alpha-1,2-mannosidase